MKKHILVIGMLLAAIGLQAQVEHNLGIHFGWDRQLYRLNSPAVSGKDKTALTKYPLNGGRLGFVYELNHDSGFGLYTAFSYLFGWQSTAWKEAPLSEKGQPAKYNNLFYRFQIETHTLELNLQPEYKFEIAGGTYLVFYTGPSFQGILEYKARDYYRLRDGTDVNPPVHVFGYNTEDMAPYYKRWNITWGLGAAFQYDRYYIRGGYDFGLVNPYNIQTFGEIQYTGDNGQKYNWFEKTDGSHEPDDRLTRGRLDNWNITFGVFFWSSED